MKSRLEQYVTNIIRHVEGTREDKEDLYEELLIHLQLSRDHLIEEEGLTVEQAEKKAIQLFGKEGEIGSQIQQALFPYRKELMLTLAISSILFTVTLYLLHLFIEGDAYFGWLIYSIIISALLLFLPLNQRVHLHKKVWLNSLLILQAFGLLYGWLLIGYFNHSGSVELTIWIWLNIALCIGLIYQTTVHGSNEKLMKILHAINITSGLIITITSLFLILGFLIMIGQFHLVMVLYISPIFLWMILYKIQLKLSNSNKKIALLVGLIPILICVSIFLWIFYPVLLN